MLNFANLKIGDRVTLANGKVYEVVDLSRCGSPTDGYYARFRQWRSPDRLYGPVKYLKPANCTVLDGGAL